MIPSEIWHRFGFTHQLVEAHEIMAIGSPRPGLQDSSDKRQERISLQLQPLKLTDTSTKLGVYILERPDRLWIVWEQQRGPCLEQALTWRCWWISVCTLDSILHHEYEIDFAPRFQTQDQSQATAQFFLKSEISTTNQIINILTLLEHFSVDSNDPFENQ